jgi:hypothetical protein
MLYFEIIAVCSEFHTKNINTLCGQNVELLNVKPGGTYSNQWNLITSDVVFVIIVSDNNTRTNPVCLSIRSSLPLDITINMHTERESSVE